MTEAQPLLRTGSGASRVASSASLALLIAVYLTWVLCGEGGTAMTAPAVVGWVLPSMCRRRSSRRLPSCPPPPPTQPQLHAQPAEQMVIGRVWLPLPLPPDIL